MHTVYLIKENGVVRYVGKTSNFTRRKREHINRIGIYNTAIPNNIDISTVEFHPIALYTDDVQALKFEDWMIRKYDTIHNGWNKQRSGNICEDMKAYERTRRQTPERKAWLKAYAHTPEQKAYERTRRQTPERKVYQKEYQRKYRLLKKQERAAV